MLKASLIANVAMDPRCIGRPSSERIFIPCSSSKILKYRRLILSEALPIRRVVRAFWKYVREVPNLCFQNSQPNSVLFSSDTKPEDVAVEIIDALRE